MRKTFLLAATVIPTVAALLTPDSVGGQARARGPRFEISFASTARSEPITGRVYVALSRTATPTSTPISQTGETGVPLYGVNVDNLAAGRSVTIDARTLGYPIASLADIPAGEYWVQPFVNVYTKFARADGKTVWLHMDQWEGQNWKRSPGNIFGDPVKIKFDPKSTRPIRLVADKVIPPITPPADNEFVKRIRIRSEILSKWWGQPIWFGATVLLPKDYDKHPEVRYPVVYSHGHFSLGAPGGFRPPSPPGAVAPAGGRGAQGSGFSDYWLADGTPRVILVTLQHPSPYYDDSYGVNSQNNGPYGDAIMQELLPAVETRFRVKREPWARLLTGGSTGGWISLAHQVFYPESYGGVWSLCPDAVDFRYHQIVNVYADTNAYWFDRGWMKVERPTRRRPDGNILAMMKDENLYELVVGDRTRSGGQWDIWEATYSPVGPDGYPKRIWDKKTGVIDPQVAEHWRQNYDLRHILQTNWPTLGPRVANKINVYVGDGDNYYLNMGVELLNNFLKTADNPKFTGEVQFQRGAPHCWGPSMTELIPKMTSHMERYAPAGADLRSWRY
ncbi:MAG TPA: alpha/beta hydrolase-fold protein [Gemmatimonadaceae bacterium]|nr:alpha/beta hydrolase-fold protein [Gemmatimonadaceae bacterium]